MADAPEKTHPDVDRMFAEYTYRHHFDQRLAFPEEIFKLANRDSLIKAYLETWRSGQCSWEAALIGIIVARQQQYETLFETVIMSMDHAPRVALIGSGVPSTAEDGKRGKAEALKYIEANKLTVLAQHGRTFIIAPAQGIKCIRWYDYIIVNINHEQLADLIKEGLAPIE